MGLIEDEAAVNLAEVLPVRVEDLAPGGEADKETVAHELDVARQQLGK